MPIYQYKCQNCENVQTANKPVNDRMFLDAVCKECGENDFEYCISTPKIVSSVTRQHVRPDWFKDRMKEIKKHVGNSGSDQFNSNCVSG